MVEWQKAKYNLLHWKENYLLQAIREGEGSTTATDWCLSRLLQPTHHSHCPMLSFIAEVCLSCPVSNVWPERAASVLKWQKNRLCSRIKNDLLNLLLQMSINGPNQGSKELPPLIQDMVAGWLKEKNRRKLKKLPAISTVASSSANTTAQSVPEVVLIDPDAPEAAPDQGPDDAPAAMEIDPCSSHVPEVVEEPNFDAYVAALKLQDCDDVDNTEDSNYESDYFSD